jgi:hypothetical protein
MTLIGESNLSLEKQFEQCIILDNWVRHYIWVVKQAGSSHNDFALYDEFKLQTKTFSYWI